MPVQWQSVDKAQHDALPRRSSTTKDPEWEDILNELQHTNNAVQIRYSDPKERGALSRSIGRRAAHRGFKVEIRHGDGFISVHRVAEQSEPSRSRKPRGGK